MKKIIDLFKTKRSFCVLTVFVFLILVLGIVGPYITPKDPYEQKLKDAFLAPSVSNICGTDQYGRDILSRIIAGTRVTLYSALLIVIISLVIGVFLGLIAGYAGGISDSIIMRFCDIMISFPDLILAMAIASILGAGFGNAIFAITTVSWTKYARLARSLALKIKYRDFIYAAKVSGSGKINIMVRYLLPNSIPTMIVTAANDIGTTMMALSGLSFLGIGIVPPTPEWGAMLSEGRSFIQTYPWMIIFPGIAILICVAVFNIWSDKLRDVLEPS